MKLRWVIRESGERTLQYETTWGGYPHWENVEEIPEGEEYDYTFKA